ncbi:MAG: indolepyruvate ferredoxin oxidoreductase subunit alpha [Desulfosporosinus sp. BRH_c37]|nr:MAG: indolepyruvate ferredoxin oxidoreductase subunit alpha [Desulfosporosinus sp. BRH_c37]
MKKLLTGNEAFAYGAYLAGVKVATAYPGTPSTEVVLNCAKYDTIYSEWSPNEKVAFDVAVGAAYAGGRALCAMKHVGLNVAADSLFYASYTGHKAGLVVINADDPGMHSSQNEQDNRNYAKFAKLPMLEPADSEEAKRFVPLAFEISEQFDTPVFIRTTTRLSHSRTIVEMNDSRRIVPSTEKIKFERNPGKYHMIPANARLRHTVVEEKIRKLAEYAETFAYNVVESGNDEIGIVTSGVTYQYAREVFPKATYLKLGMVYPLPKQLILDFAKRVKKMVIIEELDPFFEEYFKTLGIEVIGKEVFPIEGEFSPYLIREAAAKADLTEAPAPIKPVSLELPSRPPMLCPGCAHRGVFYALKSLNAVVHGDIGCYALGGSPPLAMMHTSGCMGASIGVVHGVDKVGVKDRTVAVIGDSTFFHSGIHPLINVLYNKGVSTVIISDNRITAMTGHQDNPGSGQTLLGEPVEQIDLETLVRGLGARKVAVVNPFELDEMLETLKEFMESEEPSVLIARYPCVLNIKEKHPVPEIDLEICTNCGTCLEIGCPPLAKTEDGVAIDVQLCNGCGLCVKVCPFEAIKKSNDQ